MIATHQPVACGYVLSDPQDHRYVQLVGYRHRYRDVLLDASRMLRSHEEKSAVDPILILVCLFYLTSSRLA